MTFTTQIKDEITKDNYASPDALISLCIYLKLNSEITDNSVTIYTENASIYIGNKK